MLITVGTKEVVKFKDRDEEESIEQYKKEGTPKEIVSIIVGVLGADIESGVIKEGLVFNIKSNLLSFQSETPKEIIKDKVHGDCAVYDRYDFYIEDSISDLNSIVLDVIDQLGLPSFKVKRVNF